MIATTVIVMAPIELHLPGPIDFLYFFNTLTLSLASHIDSVTCFDQWDISKTSQAEVWKALRHWNLLSLVAGGTQQPCEEVQGSLLECEWHLAQILPSPLLTASQLPPDEWMNPTTNTDPAGTQPSYSQPKPSHDRLVSKSNILSR